MSFLNPVNEPVLRFSSTDAGAPQINYNARVAGDVKTVLKACLVVGYGDKSSAGWSIANEVDHVAEFVSPSAAMSDYRLGIDDTSTSNTTWYYQYQNVRVDPDNKTITKAPSYILKTSPDNKWDLIVTARGLFFVESFYCTTVNKVLSRMTYFGQLKSAVGSANQKNIAFWSVGYSLDTTYVAQFFQDYTLVDKHFVLADYTGIKVMGANFEILSETTKSYSADAKIEMSNPMYLRSDTILVAENWDAAILR